MVLQPFGQVGLGHDAHVRRHECAVEEAGDERRVVGTQQPPRGVVLAQQIKGGVIQWLHFAPFR